MSNRLSLLPALAGGLALGAAGGYLLAPSTLQASAPVVEDRAPARPGFAPGGDQAASLPPAQAAGPESNAQAHAAAGDEQTGAQEAGSAGRRVAEHQGDAEELAQAGGPWMTELRDLLRSGRLEGKLASLQDGEDLERGAQLSILELHLRLSDPIAALDILERGSGLGHDHWAKVGGALLGSGETQLASRAYSEAIDQLPPETAWSSPLTHYIEQLAEADPAAALARAERFAQGETTPNQDLTLAQLLSKAGQGAAARERALGLIGQGELLLPAIAILAEQDPEAAEAEIRERLEAGEQSTGLDRQLLEIMLDHGRQEEAIELLEDRVASGLGDSELLLQALRGMPAGIVEEHLEGWIESSPDQSGMNFAVAGHFAGTDPGRALDYYASSFEAQFAQGSGYLRAIPDSVLLHDPGRAMSILSSGAARAGRNDEIWGDLGDHYWRLGEKQLAEQAWRQAAEIDPQDGEWSGNLQALTLDQPPVGSVPAPNYAGTRSSQTVDLNTLGYY